jgi:hypothetical protein
MLSVMMWYLFRAYFIFFKTYERAICYNVFPGTTIILLCPFVTYEENGVL